MSLMVSWYLIGLGKANSNFTSAYVIETAIEGGDKITLPETPNQFTRIDFYNGMDNQGMFWQMPTIQAFHSIVPGSVMEFYPTIGISRGVATPAGNEALRRAEPDLGPLAVRSCEHKRPGE